MSSGAPKRASLLSRILSCWYSLELNCKHCAKTGGVLHVTCSAPPGLHTGSPWPVPPHPSLRSSCKAGWGYWEQQLRLGGDFPEGDRALPDPVSQRTSYGPVQLDMDAQDYSGCVALSNNSAELSAIPQILVRTLMWRKRRLDQMQQLAKEGRAVGLHDEAAAINDIEDFERPTTLVLAYDSQYTRDMSVVSRWSG